MVYEPQRKVILELADRESCVIIGRNADYILKDRDDVLNVFIHGDMPEKTQRIMDLYNVGEKEAVKMMADTDKRRMTNYNFYTDQKWGKASNYTLCLNISIARAMLKDAPIVILDEATAYTDPENEAILLLFNAAVFKK